MKIHHLAAAVALVCQAAVFAAAPALAGQTGVRRIIEADGIRIEAFAFGEGPQTLILVAGNGRPAAQLDEIAQKIADRNIRVLTYNYRTIGASTGAVDGLTLHDYAADLWRVADAFGANKVHLAGKTYGNRVVRAAAQDRPERVLGVTLIGAGGEQPPSAETLALYRRYLDPKTPKDEWVKLQGQLMYAPGNEGLASLDAAQGEYSALAAAQVRASERTPRSEWATGGAGPMLVLTCLSDRVATPEGALSLAKSRPNT